MPNGDTKSRTVKSVSVRRDPTVRQAQALGTRESLGLSEQEQIRGTEP